MRTHGWWMLVGILATFSFAGCEGPAESDDDTGIQDQEDAGVPDADSDVDSPDADSPDADSPDADPDADPPDDEFEWEYDSRLEELEVVGSMEVSTYDEFEAAIEDMNSVAEGFAPEDLDDEESKTTVYQIRIVDDIGPDGFEENGRLSLGSGGMGSDFGIGIHVVGTTEVAPTLDAAGESGILNFSWPTVAYVENLRFTGGSAAGSHAHETGGAIRFNENRWLEIHNSEFEENLGEWASIYARQLRVYDSYFSNNSTIYLGSQPYSEPGLIEGSTFEGHTSGAVRSEQPGDIIRDSVFVDNEDSSGGAIEFGDGGRIESSEFIENTASRWGGAVWSETEDQPLEIVDSTFRDNEADGNPDFDADRSAGGAIHTDDRTGADAGVVIEGSLFDSNEGYRNGDVFAEGEGHRITTEDTTYRPATVSFLEAPDGEVIYEGGNVFEPGAYTPEELAEPFSMGDPVVVDRTRSSVVRMSDVTTEGWAPYSGLDGRPMDAAYTDADVLWTAAVGSSDNSGLVRFDNFEGEDPDASVEVDEIKHAVSVAVDDPGEQVYVFGSDEETDFSTDLEDLEFAVWSADFDGQLQQSTDDPLVDATTFEATDSLNVDSIAGITHYDDNLYVALRAPSETDGEDTISVKKIDLTTQPSEVEATYTLHDEIGEDELDDFTREIFGDLTERNGSIYVADGIGRQVLELDPDLDDKTGEIGGFPDDPEDPQPGELFGPRRFVPANSDDRLVIADQHETGLDSNNEYFGPGHVRLVAFDVFSENNWEAHGSFGFDLAEFGLF